MDKKHKFTYGTWRTDKPKEEGRSHELISPDSQVLLDKGSNLDCLHALPFEGVDTLYQAFHRLVRTMPKHPWLGTRVGDAYQWETLAEVAEKAEALSYAIMKHNLCPEITAEGRQWRFLGIQSKNRKEWVHANIANYHQRITTVALYDTLGLDAIRYVLNQTELISMVCENE